MSIGLAAGVKDAGTSSRLEAAEIEASPSSGASTGSEIEINMFEMTAERQGTSYIIY
jgi:hypothetical protein